jgi:hypothetical protein
LYSDDVEGVAQFMADIGQEAVLSQLARVTPVRGEQVAVKSARVSQQTVAQHPQAQQVQTVCCVCDRRIQHPQHLLAERIAR